MRKPAPSAQSGARILFLDIETAPLQSYHWGLWEQNIGLDMIATEWSILSFSAKWLGEKKVYYMDTGGRGPAKVRDDRALMQAIWHLLDEADIVVVQNGKAFDTKKINARMLMLGMKPYSPFKVIDTKIVAKKHFAFTSNKLEWMTGALCKIKKLKHKKFPGFELWSECLKDNKKAWAEMKAYNIIDTVALEELYLVLRPWIEGHPNVAAYSSIEEIQCPACGSTNVQKRGSAYTQTGQYHRYQCKDCGKWARSRKTINHPRKRANLLAN